VPRGRPHGLAARPAARVDDPRIDARHETIKAGLFTGFHEVFVGELQDQGGYQAVETGGEDVLVLRPAIIDLNITPPDTMSAGRDPCRTRDSA
jgi:iron uptake system EfeUOB component EfeO/EfeM